MKQQKRILLRKLSYRLSKCIQCRNKAKRGCSVCYRPLCGRCGIKKAIIIYPGKIIPRGSCNDCKTELQTKAANTATTDFVNLIMSIAKRFKPKQHHDESW